MGRAVALASFVHFNRDAAQLGEEHDRAQKTDPRENTMQDSADRI